MGLGRIVFINKTQAISVTLHFSSQKYPFKPFLFQMIGKQGQQRELCSHPCVAREWGRSVNQSIQIRLVTPLSILVVLFMLGIGLIWSM